VKDSLAKVTSCCNNYNLLISINNNSLTKVSSCFNRLLQEPVQPAPERGERAEPGAHPQPTGSTFFGPGSTRETCGIFPRRADSSSPRSPCAPRRSPHADRPVCQRRPLLLRRQRPLLRYLRRGPHVPGRARHLSRHRVRGRPGGLCQPQDLQMRPDSTGLPRRFPGMAYTVHRCPLVA
jgi:hypothetical protein